MARISFVFVISFLSVFFYCLSGFCLFICLSFRASTEEPPSKPKERALTSLPNARRHEPETERRDRDQPQLDHNANVCHAAPLDPSGEKEQKAAIEQNQRKLEVTRGHRGPGGGGRGGQTVDESRDTWKLDETQQLTNNKRHHGSTGRTGQRWECMDASGFNWEDFHMVQLF